jgi:Rrf2 family iron-responsive transcriptional regulator
VQLICLKSCQQVLIAADNLQLISATLQQTGKDMRLTKQTNYGIRIMMYCAANQGKLSQIPEIAKAYGISEPFLFKILKPLTENGLVESLRGRKGGIKLARNAADIRLSEIVRVTEDNFEMAECFRDEVTECPLVDACELNSALREALGAFFMVLDKYTVQDLALNRFRIDRLLGIELDEGSIKT